MVRQLAVLQKSRRSPICEAVPRRSRQSWNVVLRTPIAPMPSARRPHCRPASQPVALVTAAPQPSIPRVASSANLSTLRAKQTQKKKHEFSIDIFQKDFWKIRVQAQFRVSNIACSVVNLHYLFFKLVKLSVI